MHSLTGYHSKTVEIRYQMTKLISRGVIKKRQGTNYYMVTRRGHAWLNIAYCQNRYFLTPLLSVNIEYEIRAKIDGFDKFEKILNNIKNELSSIYQELNIAA